MKTILVGSDASSRLMLEKMIRAEFPNNMIFMLDERFTENISEDINQEEKRTPEDGQIVWHEPCRSIHTLIRGGSRPFPGAYTFYEGKHKLVFWRSARLENRKYIGLPGQIAEISDEYIDIVCIDGILRVYDYSNVDDIQLAAGHKFTCADQ